MLMGLSLILELLGLVASLGIGQVTGFKGFPTTLALVKSFKLRFGEFLLG
jgi:hypothetical protein